MLKSKLLLISRNKKLFLLIGIILIFLGIYVSFAANILSEKVTSWTQEFDADCGVVLTGGPSRVKEGFDLLARKKIKKLIISGVHPDVRIHELLPVWPFYVNLNENDIILEKHSRTTYGNAQQSLYIVESLRCRDIVIITSALHMLRAYNTFKSIYPAHIPIYKNAVVGTNLKPSIQDLSQEVFKSVFYSLWAY